ncbi:MAG: hypothetical protein K0Q92_1992 [Steroidobacteraceae bacterium]|nr:hypothetical protein [Steroidobacteraceae bacterium]
MTRTRFVFSSLLLAMLAIHGGAEEEPGARSKVAGHVPEQNRQAQRAPAPADSATPSSTSWWTPGDERVLAPLAAYGNSFGTLGILNTGGPVVTAGHPFFEPIGKNGRACVTCHQPANSMSLSVEMIRRRWEDTRGKDPLFAPVDGMNCPHLPADDPKSHSLLLDRGLFRIFLPWPPKAADGTRIDPEFTLEVVRDPTGCNTHPVYGLASANPMLSVYRRPRPAANLRYVTHQKFGVFAFIGKNGLPASRDPETGAPSGMNLLSDARQPTLKTQAVEAAVTHLQFDGPLDDERLRQITDFEKQLYAAQMTVDAAADARNRARESIARGHDVFMFRTFWIRDAMHLNTVGLGNPTKRTCATCHGMHMMGMDVANGWMDIGTTNLPHAREEPLNPWNARKPELPLFKVTCKSSVPPHPFLGRVIYTQDPGRALISGKCNDVGTIVMQQLRGLSARAPYFSNGAAESLREMIDFYDRRFDIGFTEREREDLVNFLSAL